MFRMIMNESITNIFNITENTSRKNYFTILATYMVFSFFYYYLLSNSLTPKFIDYIIYILFLPVMIISMVSISIRRLNDSGMNPSWIFINFIPTLGNLIFLILMLLPSESLKN